MPHLQGRGRRYSMKVTIHGTGYVGLVTGVCIAQVGNHVVCVDIDAVKIGDLQRGEVPIYEAGLTELVRRNVAAGRLRFTTDVGSAVRHGDIQMIAVGTPKNEDGSADLSHVLDVAESIGAAMDRYLVIVDKSTVPVGTADRVRERIAGVLARRRADLDFDVVSNPEFLKEGAAVADFMKPDRIIVGTDSQRATETLRQLYEPFSRSHEKLIVMDVRSAELTKYAANVMLATKISLMNEIANIAERYGADIEQVRIGIGSDPRIGYSFIYPGCGYGGSCFPKDVHALIRSASEVDYDAELVRAVDRVNERQKTVLFSKINAHYSGKLRGRTFALWGLAFKPNTDDMREAPSRSLMEALWAAGARVRAFDPQAMAETRRAYGERADLQLCDSANEALVGSDALIVVTEWQEFRSPDLAAIKSALVAPVIFDGRNIYDPKVLSREGFTHYAIGRGQALRA
jgi:UDPglucose 6-dehydrogenase